MVQHICYIHYLMESYFTESNLNSHYVVNKPEHNA